MDVAAAASPDRCPAFRRCARSAKAVAEMQAWSIAGQQDRWRLVAICPATVYGPLLAHSPGMGA